MLSGCGSEPENRKTRLLNPRRTWSIQIYRSICQVASVMKLFTTQNCYKMQNQKLAEIHQSHNDRTQTWSDIWITIGQIDVTCFIISLFTAQHISNVSTSIFKSLRLIVDLFHGLYCAGSMCVGVTVWFGWGGVVLQPP
jgi:hypothetical protein